MRQLIIASFAAIFAASAAAQEASRTPRVDGQGAAVEIEIILNEVNTDDYPQVLILATVLEGGVPRTGLGAGDFRVREDEVDQAPLTVEPQLPPLWVVVALDSSGSMSRRMAETKVAATEFVASLGGSDAVQLLRFAREIETPTPMTSEKSEVIAAIEVIAARGDTALFDALQRSIELVADRRGRKAVVLLSDGVDDDGTGRPLSTSTIEDVLARAGAINVPIFAIGLGTEMDEAVLIEIAEATGAQYLNAPDPSELGAIYGSISDQLSGQYAIRYTSSLPADGVARRVDLAALGAQGSKSYSPAGAPAAAAEEAPAGVCAPADAFEAERADLQQAKERYEADLISVTDRDAIRDGAIERIELEIEAGPIDLDCVRGALKAAAALYDEDLISVTARDDLRDALGLQLSGLCEARDTIEGHVECLTYFRDAYRDDAISVTMRDDLRTSTLDVLVPELIEASATDEALMLLGELYNDDRISVTQRDDNREKLLAAE